MTERYAAIDIGTVTCRMLVADVEGGRVVPVARRYAITNLGEGVDAAGVLKREAMDRVARVIEGYLAARDTLNTPESPVRKTVCVATSAARDAENAAEFTEMLAKLGLELAVIPGEQEAALSFRGASAEFAGAGEHAGERRAEHGGDEHGDGERRDAALPAGSVNGAASPCSPPTPVPPRIMVVDVGGGSTEVVTGPAGGNPETAHSFDIGCRRVTERFLKSDPPTAGELAAARAWCAEQFAAYFEQTPAARAVERMVAVAGTATTAVSIREQMETYDSARVHGAQVTRSELAGIEQRLASLPLRERERVVGLDPGRAPVITAGLLILEEVMRAVGAERFTASESDILQGIVLAAAGK
ncbi:MAG: Ppx/GppA family phosphatase [Eggerthellaceae bacterium]|nr:Ppx/GppA family phosphatase [Eggerthellaceae bacterium]